MKDYSALTQDYIEGLLQGEALEDFERTLKNDEELRTLVHLQEEVHLILTRRVQTKELELRNMLSTAEKQQRFGRVTKVFNYRKFASIAAVFVAIIMASIYFYNSNNAYYTLPVLQSEVVRGEVSDNQFESAVEDFNANKYSSATTKFSGLLLHDPEVAQYKYYLGLSYLGNKQYKESIGYLQDVAQGKSIFVQEAKYYLAVAYIENNDKSKAKEVLNSLPKSDEKVNKLLKRVE